MVLMSWPLGADQNAIAIEAIISTAVMIIDCGKKMVSVNQHTHL